jgi:hypothetical protein
MYRKSGFIVLVLMGVLGMTGITGAADTSKAEVKACQRSCGDSARTDPAQYERCMIDCKTTASDVSKHKHNDKIH